MQAEAEHRLERKRAETVAAMKRLKAKLETGDDSELLAWIIPGALASAQRPLRHHPLYAGSGAIIPKPATNLVFEWAARIRALGIKSIVSFMHERDRRCYSELDLGAADITGFFESQGFQVQPLPWEDPGYSKADEKTKRRNLESNRAKALAAFDGLPKPVLLQCSSGIDRSAPVAAFIWLNRHVEVRKLSDLRG
jgi:hypothetical protein